jgi:hypothetical protein
MVSNDGVAELRHMMAGIDECSRGLNLLPFLSRIAEIEGGES